MEDAEVCRAKAKDAFDARVCAMLQYNYLVNSLWATLSARGVCNASDDL